MAHLDADVQPSLDPSTHHLCSREDSSLAINDALTTSRSATLGRQDSSFFTEEDSLHAMALEGHGLVRNKTKVADGQARQPCQGGRIMPTSFLHFPLQLNPSHFS